MLPLRSVVLRHEVRCEDVSVCHDVCCLEEVPDDDDMRRGLPVRSLLAALSGCAVWWFVVVRGLCFEAA